MGRSRRRKRKNRHKAQEVARVDAPKAEQPATWDQIVRDWPLAAEHPDEASASRRAELASASPCPPHWKMEAAQGEQRAQAAVEPWPKVSLPIRQEIIEMWATTDRRLASLGEHLSPTERWAMWLEWEKLVPYAKWCEARGMTLAGFLQRSNETEQIVRRNVPLGLMLIADRVAAEKGLPSEEFTGQVFAECARILDPSIVFVPPARH